MANHKSALKRNRQSQVRRLRNRANKSKLKTVVKELLLAIDEKSVEKAQDALKTAIKAIDKTAGKGIIPRNTASRKISRLTRRVHTFVSSMQ